MLWDGLLVVDRKYVDALFAKYPERLTPQDLEEIFGMSRNTIYKWLQTGLIPAYRVEKTWLISREQVKDWVWENRNSLKEGRTPPSTGEPEA
ncbi:helix-turn-helix domain-containing protein [Arthrobacter sp. NPDC057009]|uniref:helix-turn-helix domain-containing protein n=1 Tax=Arthrobacter sp. NPDC057009 TaxID=3345996 RepID=UPI003625BD9E